MVKRMVEKWTPEQFDFLMENLHKIYEESFDYSLIKSKDIDGCETAIPLICRTCNFKFFPTIRTLLKNSKYKCPCCTGRICWKPNEQCHGFLLHKLREKYGENFDYSEIKIEDINN